MAVSKYYLKLIEYPLGDLFPLFQGVNLRASHLHLINGHVSTKFLKTTMGEQWMDNGGSTLTFF